MQFIFQRPFKLAVLLILTLVISRWYVGGQDFSYFAVIGDDFAKDSSEFMTVEGPGYDGQFFYRLAQKPFSFENESHAIHFDHPAYRHQRIVYPLISWILSVGNDNWTGLALVLCNAIAFLILIQVILQFCRIYGVKGWLPFLALLFSGMWMSIGRDLSEVVECMFVLLIFWQLETRNLKGFLVFTTLALLTRETSAIILFPLAVVWLIHDFRLEKNFKSRINKFVLLLTPFAVLLIWKCLVVYAYGSTLLEGGGNFTYPFYGLYIAFRELSLNLTDATSYVEFVVWLAFIVWTGWLIVLSIPTLELRSKNMLVRALSFGWIFSVLTTIHFSHSIFIDDWSFQRVLLGFFLLCNVLMIVKKTRLPNAFILASVLLVLSTLGRLIIKV